MKVCHRALFKCTWIEKRVDRGVLVAESRNSRGEFCRATRVESVSTVIVD
jgi:hypothetical protein